MAFVYSCCIWFSLRLGGILIACFSILQGLLILACCCIAHTRMQEIVQEVTHCIEHMNLIYIKNFAQNFTEDPEKYINFALTLTCAYIFVCILYIYGAYMYNNLLMVMFILMELLRLTAVSIVVLTWLLILKQNTMDIGILIGASVASGFFLLGMFYLWVCAANLPVVINELERDEQAATISRLQQLLELNNNKTVNYSGLHDLPSGNGYNSEVFVTEKYKKNKGFNAGSRIPVAY